MLSLGLKIFTDIPLTVIGLALFVTAFTLIFLRTFFRPQSKSFYQNIAEFALREDQNHERR